jgi:hypothetical protein
MNQLRSADGRSFVDDMMEVISVRLRCEVERLGGEAVVMSCVEVSGGKEKIDM